MGRLTLLLDPVLLLILVLAPQFSWGKSNPCESIIAKSAQTVGQSNIEAESFEKQKAYLVDLPPEQRIQFVLDTVGTEGRSSLPFEERLSWIIAVVDTLVPADAQLAPMVERAGPVFFTDGKGWARIVPNRVVGFGRAQVNLRLGSIKSPKDLYDIAWTVGKSLAEIPFQKRLTNWKSAHTSFPIRLFASSGQLSERLRLPNGFSEDVLEKLSGDEERLYSLYGHLRVLDSSFNPSLEVKDPYRALGIFSVLRPFVTVAGVLGFDYYFNDHITALSWTILGCWPLWRAWLSRVDLRGGHALNLADLKISQSDLDLKDSYADRFKNGFKLYWFISNLSLAVAGGAVATQGPAIWDGVVHELPKAATQLASIPVKFLNGRELMRAKAAAFVDKFNKVDLHEVSSHFDANVLKAAVDLQKSWKTKLVDIDEKLKKDPTNAGLLDDKQWDSSQLARSIATYGDHTKD